ncbi:MAG: hypothetical protein Q7U75_20075 [Desulfobacterales bacterium]|nr:hypothetical protein [Desulfobacterales bacterium]
MGRIGKITTFNKYSEVLDDLSRGKFVSREDRHEAQQRIHEYEEENVGRDLPNVDAKEMNRRIQSHAKELFPNGKRGGASNADIVTDRPEEVRRATNEDVERAIHELRKGT